MAEIHHGRWTARIDGDFVVFLIGLRVNRPWKLHKWLPIVRAMPRMIAELEAHPELGCLATQSAGLVTIQYWRSFDHLEAYARSADRAHWPAWAEFNRKVRASSGDVGIWHESFLVPAGAYETLYGAMPRIGLARAGRHLPAAKAARERLDGARVAAEGAPAMAAGRAPAADVAPPPRATPSAPRIAFPYMPPVDDARDRRSK